MVMSASGRYKRFIDASIKQEGRITMAYSVIGMGEGGGKSNPPRFKKHNIWEKAQHLGKK